MRRMSGPGNPVGNNERGPDVLCGIEDLCRTADSRIRLFQSRYSPLLVV